MSTMTRGERILEAIEDEVMQRLNPSGEDCPECGGEGYTYDCFEEFACIDPEGGCDLCERRCDWCNPKKSKVAETSALRGQDE